MEWLNYILTSVITAISSGLIFWRINRKKANANADYEVALANQKIEEAKKEGYNSALEKLKIYNVYIEDMDSKLVKLVKQYSDLEAKYDKLKNDYNELENKYLEVKISFENLSKKINDEKK